ncbi:MAG: fibronectin type III domain-containing protein [Crocinitomicaceae bacterium]
MRKIYLLGIGLMFMASNSIAQYCVAGGPTDDFDTNVEAVDLTGETTNISYVGCTGGGGGGILGVEDQTVQVADLIAGSSYSVDITWGSCGGSFGNGGEAWIDFDGSQTFDAGESIGTIDWGGGTGNLQTYGFTVPALALNGTHRMRVMAEEGGITPLDPCASFTYGSVVDFSITISGGSSCGAATALNTSNPTTTTMDLNWTADGGSIGDNVEWGLPGFTPGTGAEEGSAAAVVGGTTTATALLPGTTYEFYVETDCGGTQAAWAGPFAFTTAGSCGYFEVSLFDTFGDGWNGGTVDVYINGVLFQAGLTVATGNGPVVYQIPANTGDILSFDYTASGFPTENEITILDETSTIVAQEGIGGTTPNDIGDFTIPTGLEACPSCPTPTTLATANVTGTTADFSWVEAGTSTDWIIEYGPAGFTPGTGTDLVTTNNPETVSGLTPTTTYEFYVRAICGVGDTSNYAGPVVVTTTLAPLSCGSGNPFVLYSNDFESGSFPSEWSTVATGDPDWSYDNAGGTGSANTGPSAAFSGAGFVYLETSGGAFGDADTMTAGPFDLSSVVDAARVTFYYHMYGDDMGTLSLETSSDGVFWTSAWSLTGTQQTDELDPWIPTEVDVTSLAGGDLYLRFIGSKGTGGSGFAGDMAIDLVQIEACVTCPGPSNLVTSNVTETTVDLDWTTAGVATSWIVEYGPAGFTPGTGTSVTVSSPPPFTLTGLTDLTTYDIYVQGDCGGGDVSGPVGPATITTPLANLTCTAGNPLVLYAQDFEGGFPADWSQVNTADPDWTYDGAGGTGSTNTGPSGAQSGTGFVYLEVSGGANGASDTLYSPMIDLSSSNNETRLVFHWHMYGLQMGTMDVDISTDGVNWTNEFTQTGQVQTDELDPWMTEAIDLVPYAGGPIWVRFVGTKGTGFEGDMAIDNFYVESCITCPPVSGLTSANTDETSTELTWTAGGSETAWIIEYGPTGFTPGTGTTVASTNNTDELVSGLIDNTDYDFYVYADCGGGDVSTVVGPEAVTTDIFCDAPTGLAFEYASNDTVSITWTPVGLETAWNVEWGVTGFTPGTGTLTNVNNFPDTTFGVPAGGVFDFYVQADCGFGVNNPWVGPITYISPIVNDSTCDAIPVPVDGSTTVYSNVGATMQTGTIVPGFNSVWFTFVAPASGHVEIMTCGNDFDNLLAVYEKVVDCSDFGTFTFTDGATGNPFVGCSGTFDPAGINLCGLVPGDTYYLAIGSETDGVTGTFPLTLTELPAFDAGTAVPTDVCEDNSAFDLFTTITGNLTTTGQWYNPVAAPGNEFASLINIVGAPAGTYTFDYVHTELCGADTVSTSITVIETPNVGVGSTLSAGCNYNSVALTDGLSGTVDFGGTWYDESGNDLGTALVTYDGEPAGSYDYYYVVDNGVCAADTATVTVDVIDCASITENTLVLDVYPNPVKDILTIQLVNVDANASVELYNLQGSLVSAPIAVNNSTVNVSMAAFADGVYILKVTSNGATQEVRVVKQ